MSAALDLKSAAALSQITEMKNCCLIGKCQHSRLQKLNLKRLLLFYILCEEFRSLLVCTSSLETKLLCVYLLEIRHSISPLQ